MSSNGAKLCSYFLIRIAPDPVRQEFLNIGVALFDSAGGFADLRLIHDYRRLQCLFPGLDLEADLPQLESALREELRQPDRLLAAADEKFSLALQFTERRSVLTADPAQELERLFAQYARPPALAAAIAAALSPRRQLQARMKTEFQAAGVLQFLSPEWAVAQFMPTTDRFRFDYHYRPNGVHKLLHAVTRASDSSVIKELSYTVSRLAARKIPLELTAITEAASEAAGLWGEGEAAQAGQERWQEHERMLAEAGIQIRMAAELPGLAQKIRSELSLG